MKEDEGEKITVLVPLQVGLSKPLPDVRQKHGAYRVKVMMETMLLLFMRGKSVHCNQ